MTKSDIIGDIPREISRFCHFFINYGGAINARVSKVKYRPSPIPSKGLEIPIMMEFVKENATADVYRKMENYVQEYYTEPENLRQLDNNEADDDDYEQEILDASNEELNIVEEREGVIGGVREETENNEF